MGTSSSEAEQQFCTKRLQAVTTWSCAECIADWTRVQGSAQTPRLPAHIAKQMQMCIADGTCMHELSARLDLADLAGIGSEADAGARPDTAMLPPCTEQPSAQAQLPTALEHTLSSSSAGFPAGPHQQPCTVSTCQHRCYSRT